AIRFTTRGIWRRCQKCAGCGERTQVQKIERHTTVVNWSDHIRSVEPFPRTRVIAFKKVIQMEWLTVLYAERTIQSPAIFELGETSADRWERVCHSPCKPAANIKTRIAAFTCRIQAVRGLRLVRDEIFTVACNVNRM